VWGETGEGGVSLPSPGSPRWADGAGRSGWKKAGVLQAEMPVLFPKCWPHRLSSLVLIWDRFSGSEFSSGVLLAGLGRM